MKKYLTMIAAAVFVIASASAQTTTNIPDLLPSVDQSGTIAGVFGAGSTNETFQSIYKFARDGIAFVEGNTNGFARITVEGGYLMTKHEGNGGFGAVYFPLMGTNTVLGAGFGVAYLNHNWYDATLSARITTPVPLPLGLQKFFPVYGFAESGGGWNFGTHQGIAQAFTGATLHYILYRTRSGNTFDLTGGYAVGTISDIKDNVQAAGGSLTFCF